MEMGPISSVEELGKHTRLFIESLEVGGAKRIRVDEWKTEYLGHELTYRFNYAHAEQRIHVKVAGTEVLIVSINLANEPMCYPVPQHVHELAIKLWREFNLRQSTGRKFVGWDLTDGTHSRGIAQDGATVVE